MIGKFLKIYRRLYGSERRQITEVLKRIEETLSTEKTPLVFFEAPTGYGKTAIPRTLSIYSLMTEDFYTKVVHVLPLRAIVDDVIKKTRERFCRALNIKEHDINVLVGGQSMDHEDVFFLDAPYTVTTFDTFLMSALKLNPKMMSRIKEEKSYGYDYFTLGSIYSSFLIFDEVHYVMDFVLSKNDLRSYSLPAVFLGVLRKLLYLRTPMLFMSATIPSGFVKYVKHIAEVTLRRDCKAYEIIDMTHNNDDFNPDYDQNRPSGIAELSPKSLIREDSLYEIAESVIKDEKRLLIVRNNPRSAVRVYKKLRDFGYHGVLVHGKLTAEDRAKALRSINDVEFIVTTQVIEAGVDISADVLITDPAPISSLIQRAGRVARYSRKDHGVVYIIQNDFYKPYPEEIVRCSIEVVKENLSLKPFDMHEYSATVELIEKIYGDIERNLQRVPTPAIEKIMGSKWIRSTDVWRLRREVIKSGNPFIRELLIPCYILSKNVLEYSLSGILKRDLEDQRVLSLGMWEVGGLLKHGVSIHGISFKDDVLKIIPPKELKKMIEERYLSLVERIVDGDILLAISEDDYEDSLGPRWLLYD